MEKWGTAIRLKRSGNEKCPTFFDKNSAFCYRFRTSVLKLEKHRKKLKKIGKNMEKYIDFSAFIRYTVITWSKMVAKWSKMEWR